MTKVAIIRCEKNMDRCPLTGCFRSLTEQKEGFSHYDDSQLAGIFTCKCPGENVVNLAKILKKKGADVIHFCTCLFARKGDDGWDMTDGGFCKHLDEIIEKIHHEVKIPCVKGTAHLPEGYSPEKWT